ncbi:hypothetical protein EB001_18140 [bacterium]|nr:hypothetical protein [bacterium]
MKIYMNKPKDNWLSPYTIIEKAMFWREIDYDEPIVEFWNCVLSPFCLVLFDISQFFNRDIRYVKIDPWDTWSMDTTLTRIILPMLKQLKKDKHGAPHVDNEDVPSELRDKRKVQPKNGETDKNYFNRWDYVMDQMIWSFNELSKPDWDSQFWTGRVDSKWVKLPDGHYELKHGPKHTLKFDKKGHDKHWARIQNGLRLFGKYYTALWD